MRSSKVNFGVGMRIFHISFFVQLLVCAGILSIELQFSGSFQIIRRFLGIKGFNEFYVFWQSLGIAKLLFETVLIEPSKAYIYTILFF